MKIRDWRMVEAGKPLVPGEREVTALAAGEALVRVAGCGLCHTDLGFLYDGVRTRHPLPLVLGHEISGVVEDAGADHAGLVAAAVVVPAVMPCETCPACRRGRGSICPRQIFPGNDIHGGFASHVVVPARSLCRVPQGGRGADVGLAGLAVLADAISTPFQAVRRSGLGPGDVAVFVGAGGVGGFGIQIAAALGAFVAAVDIDEDRLDAASRAGARLVIDASGLEGRAIKKTVRDAVRAAGLSETEWKVFETSGTPAGQETAFSLLVPGAWLGVVGYTPKPVTVPLSHLMAFDARAEGNWGCLPSLYPEALRLVLDGKVRIAPFIEERPMSSINDVLAETHARKLKRRAVLIPDFA